MQRRLIALSTVLALAGAVGVAAFLRNRTENKAPATQPAVPDDEPPAARRDRTPPPPVVPSQRPAPQVGVESARVAVGRAQTLATVNGVTITGRDLVAFRDRDGNELSMSRPLFDDLLRKAIRRELTVQAAKARDVELTDADRAEVAAARAHAAARGETDPAVLDSEERRARADLLLSRLAEKEGAPPQFAGEADVDRFLAEQGPLPTDPAELQRRRIEARQQLYGEFSTKYQAHVRALLERLESEARITR